MTCLVPVVSCRPPRRTGLRLRCLRFAACRQSFGVLSVNDARQKARRLGWRLLRGVEVVMCRGCAER